LCNPPLIGIHYHTMNTIACVEMVYCKSSFQKSMTVLITGVLLFKAPAHAIIISQ